MKIKLIFLLIFIPQVLLAQSEISGLVVNGRNEVLNGVIVLQKNNTTDKLMRYTKTDSQGKFSLRVVAQDFSNSYIECSLLGFKKKK